MDFNICRVNYFSRALLVLSDWSTHWMGESNHLVTLLCLTNVV